MPGIERRLRGLLVLTVLGAALALAGCGNTTTEPPDMGGGDDGGAPDLGAPDDPDLGGGGIAPFVVFNVPQNQAEDIQTDTNILLVFSESMDPTVGTVSI
ncbi:MAG: Ig-like domain-containing protein, partial [Sandaracinaceae bacterium]